MSERRCPICDEPAAAPHEEAFPFCSRRCRLVDLGNWLGESYRFEGDPVPDHTGDGDYDGGFG